MPGNERWCCSGPVALWSKANSINGAPAAGQQGEAEGFAGQQAPLFFYFFFVGGGGWLVKGSCGPPSSVGVLLEAVCHQIAAWCAECLRKAASLGDNLTRVASRTVQCRRGAGLACRVPKEASEQVDDPIT